MEPIKGRLKIRKVEGFVWFCLARRDWYELSVKIFSNAFVHEIRWVSIVLSGYPFMKLNGYFVYET